MRTNHKKYNVYLKSAYRYNGNERDTAVDDFISDIAFFNGNCNSCQICREEAECPANFTDILVKVKYYHYTMYWT